MQYIKFLGRRSDVISVGGEKVHPHEVEDVLLEMEDIDDVRVYGERSHILGQIVCAEVVLRDQRCRKDIKREINAYCSSKLPRYKIPARVRLIDQVDLGGRYKKTRYLGNRNDK